MVMRQKVKLRFLKMLSLQLHQLQLKVFNRGVRVNIGERETIVDVYITIEYGIKIVEVSEKVQEEVKEAIENMTDFDVVEVNVHISGIAVKNSEKTVVK